MASGSVRPVAAPPEVRVAADKVIDSQLGRVRRHIRITDLIAGIMVLFAGVFAFLILVAVVDHWIVGLGVAGRFLVLLALIGGAGWHLAVNVIPLLLRRINPAYAAQTIERGEPTLKNSLLNYLLLRRESTGVQAQIYQAIQQRAAADVSRVEVDQTVDRSTLIRAGYALVAIMAVAAAYKILSPKDPFQTVRRIASPWSDIARPARVTIEGVEPGNAEVIQGQTVEVSAVVRGDRSGEDVKLICSSVDGQIVDQIVVMKPDSAGLRHVGHLPPGGSRKQPSANQQSGIQQDLVYRISAGDASTPEFRLRVSPAPTITVDTVEYDFPAYTQRPREVIEHQGDLKAVEGTRVTVRARANQPIRTATIELTSPATAGAAKGLSERLAMEFRETAAWRIWTLELAADRQSPKFSAYQATFVNQAGLTSRDPVTYRIEVVPDLPPEVEILTPNKETVQVPVSGEQRIEIRAIDPDFGLSGLRLKAVCAGREILDQPLLENSIGQSGQLVVEFKFRPRDHQLSAGSQVTYWAVAADNRQTEAAPQPNTARTPNRTLAIVDDPPERPTQPGEAAADKSEAPTNDPQPMPSATKPKTGDKTQPSAPNDKRDPDQPDSDSKEQQAEKGSQNKQHADGQPDSKQQPGKQSSGQQKGGASGKGQPQSGDGQPGNQQDGGNSGASPDGAAQPGQGTSGQKPGGNTTQQNSPGTRESAPGNDPNGAGEVRDGAPPGQRSEPLHDGEVFEKALERLKQQQQLEKSNQQQPPTTPGANDQTESQGSATKNQDESDGTPAKDQSKGSPDETSKPGSTKQKSSQEPTPPNQKAKSTDKSRGATDQSKPQPGTDQNPNQSDKDQADKGQAGKNQSDKNQTDKNQTGKKSSDGGEKGTATGKKESGQPNQERSPKTGEQPKPGTPKQPGANDQGKSGAGQKDDEKTGSGEKATPQGDRPMTQQPDNATSPPGDPPPPNQSERSSDSKGQESGDRKGGGKKGAGQGASQAGEDTAGSNSASDEGAGAAKEPGQGEKSSSAGKQQTSPTPNSKSAPGTEKGPGSQTKSDPQGNQPPAQPAPDASAQPPDQNKNQDQNKQPESGRPSGSGKTPGGQGAPTGGGQPADNAAGTPPANAEAAPGDDANLDYSRRATDMVLEYLKDQKDKPDERLLDELGWTAEDLRGFLERWQKLKQSAGEDPVGRRDLDESLRGLGLRPQSDSKRTGGKKSDDIRGLRESGIKSVPPSSYQEQFNAFKKGASRSQPK